MPPLKPFSLWVSTGERAGLVTVLSVQNDVVTARWLSDNLTFVTPLPFWPKQFMPRPKGRPDIGAPGAADTSAGIS